MLSFSQLIKKGGGNNDFVTGSIHTDAEAARKNIRLIVDLLRTMSVRENAQTQVFRRTGLAKEAVNLPGDFDETFDALDHDIEEMFYGDSL